MATSEHHKNGNYTYNLSRYQERFKYPSVYDHFKIRSEYTEHPKQNNKDLTPGISGQFIPAYYGQDR